MKTERAELIPNPQVLSYCLWHTFDGAMCHNRSGLTPGVREVLGTPVAMPLADPKAAEQARFFWWYVCWR